MSTKELSEGYLDVGTRDEGYMGDILLDISEGVGI